MRYWWVNQNQTYRHEIAGGYLWSPKRNTNKARNPFYESMREVAPGDIIFSFRDTRIAALGIARSYCYESPKPTEFGTAGSYWGAIGWKIDGSFRELDNRIHPKSHIGELRGLLPEKYSPLRANGDGLQSVYLAEVGRPFAAALFRLIGGEANKVADVARQVDRAEQLSPSREPDLERWEERVEHDIREDPKIPDTQREAIIQARVGQGRFRANVQGVERACRVTKVDRLEHLVASHTKPWRDSTNEERLDGENGLLLTPTIDHLFDKGFISFENSGDLIVSPVADRPSLLKMGIKPEGKVNVGVFSEGQRVFLNYHRENVLRMSRRR
ncbi:MAG: HNH endonuclease signature motif containing protein [Pseudomonadota bacterium]